MPETVIDLDRNNIEAATGAMEVLALFRLKDDLTYPFLDAQNWTSHGWESMEFRFGSNRVVTPVQTFEAFMVVSDKMRAKHMGFAVADTLKKALACLKERQETLKIFGGKTIYMGGANDVASESMVYWEVALQAIALLVQEKSMAVLEALDVGSQVQLRPPK